MRQLRGEIESQPYVYSATTAAIEVNAHAYFLEDQSSPAECQYVWGYKIKIRNCSDTTVQLLSRRWIITDCQGFTQEVFGNGVVGEQPTLNPGEFFEYSSYSTLYAPSGMMVGFYKMVSQNGEFFDVAVPPFSLDSPEYRSLPN